MSFNEASGVSSEEILKAYDSVLWDKFPRTLSEKSPGPVSCSLCCLDPTATIVTSAADQRKLEESKIRKSNNLYEARCGVSQPELWHVTTTEQLNAILLKNPNTAERSPHIGEVKSATYHDTNFKEPVNRTHISEFFHYEEDAKGIDALGSDLPMYQWDWDNLQQNPVGHHVVNNENKQKLTEQESQSAKPTSYIPTQIYGSQKFVEDLQKVCRECL